MNERDLFWKTVKAAETLDRYTYDNTTANDICANYHKGEPHSVAANPTRQSRDWQLFRVLKAISARKQAIAEDIELQFKETMGRSTPSARMTDAKRLGLIEKCGTGKTTSGRSAGMYRLTELGKERINQ